MMRKIMKGALIVAAILMLRAEAQQSEQVAAPQKAAEGERINPKLWYTLMFQDARADLFTHWERVHPHRTLFGATTPRVYKRNTQSVDAVTYEYDGERYSLSDYIEKADVSGLMVLHGGEVRLEYYGKGLDAQSRNHIWSATKSFTATLVGMALFEGKISSLDDTAEQYAPQFKDTAYGKTSVRHLLMMSSGIDYFHFSGTPDRNDMYNDLIQEGGDFDQWAAALPRRVPGGTDFNYIATDTHVLAAVLRGAYGKPFVDIVQEKLWEPFGFHEAKWGLDAHGHATGHFALSLTLQDFAQLGQLYLEDLMLNGKPTVSDDWFGMVEKAHTPSHEPHPTKKGNVTKGYSFQFWLPLDYDQEFIALGAFEQYLWIDRKRDFVVAQFSIGGAPNKAGASAKEFEVVMRALGSFVIGDESLPEEEVADLILKDANVITVDPDRPRAEAIAIEGGLILAVGTNDEIDALAGDATKVFSLNGATVVPGLIDAHMHFTQLGKRTKQLFLDETRSPEEVVAIVEEQVRNRSVGEWVLGTGWHTVMWGGAAYPDNSALNEVAPDNPVYLVGMASHAVWANDAALRLAGVDKDTPDPVGGRIVKHADTGAPTGMLLEEATLLVSDVLPKETRASKKADFELSVRTANAMGFTSVHDAGVNDDDIEVFKELLAEGKLDVRLYLMYDIASPGPVLDEYISKPPEIGLGDNRLTLRSLKVYADGALGARGAVLLDPYSDQHEAKGLVQNSEEALYQIITRAMKAGYQVSTHAIGDGGNRAMLNAVERAQEELPGLDPRHRNEHAQIISPDDIPRFGELGVIASMQPIHCTLDMGFVERRIGSERMAGAYAWKSLLDSGAILVGSADTPAFPVLWTNPMLGIYAAVTRQDADGNPPGGFYPEQRLSRMEALKMYTVSAAYAAFEEDVKGTLTPGKLADITVLSKDILSIPASEILETKALMTIVGGKVVFQRAGFLE